MTEEDKIAKLYDNPHYPIYSSAHKYNKIDACGRLVVRALMLLKVGEWYEAMNKIESLYQLVSYIRNTMHAIEGLQNNGDRPREG